MKFKTEKLIFTKLPIKEVLNNSKQFLKNITNRRTVRDFSNREIDLKIIITEYLFKLLCIIFVIEKIYF